MSPETKTDEESYALYIGPKSYFGVRPKGRPKVFVLVWDTVKIPWPEGMTAPEALLAWKTNG